MNPRDDADLAVLDTALAEELDGARAPDLWARLAARPMRRRSLPVWLAAALVLIGTAVVVTFAASSRDEDDASAAQPFRIDVDDKGPASLAGLQQRLADADRATLTAEATWSDELRQFVPLVRWDLERLFKPSTQPELGDDELAAIAAAVHTATGGEPLRDVEWTHSIKVSGKETRARLLLQWGLAGEPIVAFASPHGPIGLIAPRFPFGSLGVTLQANTHATIAGLGVVIGTNGFDVIPADAKRLKLFGVPAAAAGELARYQHVGSVDLAFAPAWHSTAVLRAVARPPLRSLVVDPRQLAADAYPLLASVESLRELFLVEGDAFDAHFGPWRRAPAPGLDDAAIRALCGARGLTELTIAGGVFGDDALRALGALPALKQLALIGCTRFGGESLAAFGSVERLALYDCSGLRDDFLASVATLPKLNRLGVRDVGRRLDLSLLRGAASLRELHLVTFVPPDELRLLADLPALRKLTLWYEPPLRDADLIWLHGLRQLKSLGIISDAVTEEGLAAVRAALPGCSVKREL